MITPTKDYIIVEAPDIEVKTDSGIYLPDKRSEVHQTGTVVGGEGYNTGDTIWFKKWAGEEISYGEDNFLLIHRKDIIGYERNEKSVSKNTK